MKKVQTILNEYRSDLSRLDVLEVFKSKDELLQKLIDELTERDVVEETEPNFKKFDDMTQTEKDRFFDDVEFNEIEDYFEWDISEQIDDAINDATNQDITNQSDLESYWLERDERQEEHDKLKSAMDSISKIVEECE